VFFSLFMVSRLLLRNKDPNSRRALSFWRYVQDEQEQTLCQYKKLNKALVKTADLLHLLLTDPIIADPFVDRKVLDAGNLSVEKEIYSAAAEESAQRLDAGHVLRRRWTFGVEILVMRRYMAWDA
jgi:hypothetical protein